MESCVTYLEEIFTKEYEFMNVIRVKANKVNNGVMRKFINIYIYNCYILN